MTSPESEQIDLLLRSVDELLVNAKAGNAILETLGTSMVGLMDAQVRMSDILEKHYAFMREKVAGFEPDDPPVTPSRPS